MCAVRFTNFAAPPSKNRRIPPFSQIGTVPAIPGSSGGRAAGETRQGIDEMTTTSFSQRVFAAFAAFGMTSFMLVSYFYVPASHVVPGIVA
jgi:hypothetical protein